MSTPLTQHGLRLVVPFQGHPEMKVPVVAYAFNPHMKLLATAPVVDGTAELPLTEQQARTARIMIAPPVPTGEAPTYQKVRRMNPYRAVWRFEEGKAEYQLLPVPELFGRAWRTLSTRVRGRVVKSLEIHGQTVELGVPTARVTIYEVDPRFVLRERIDLEDLINIRDRIKEQYEVLIKWPFPPGPPPVEVELPMLLKRVADLDDQQIRTLPPLDARAMVEQLAVGARQHAGLLSLIRPWLFYSLEEQIPVYTDPDGHFDVAMNYWPYMMTPDSPAEPLPDLYFKVEWRVAGEWTLVYAKPVARDTYWEYDGRFVLLNVTDPRVVVYPPPEFLDGQEVGVLTIGNTINVAQIQNGLTAAGAPFGGTLEPHVLFGEALAAAGALYRWSYRKAGTAEPWRPITTPVERHYQETLSNGHLVVKSFPLGPIHLPVLGPVFKVQPIDPPAGIWAPQVAARPNTATAFWNTLALDGGDVELADGLYDLKLELFDSHGHPLAIRFRVPRAGLPVTSANLVPVPGADAEDTQDAFLLQVRVDNRPCAAAIGEVRVAGHPMDRCGFIVVPPTEVAGAEVAFVADQPGGFATFDFTLAKSTRPIDQVQGTVRQHVVTQNLPAETSLPAHEYTRNGNRFTALIPVADLLAPCTRAAFGEYLYVHATATDGWRTLSEYDRAAGPVAFAIDQRP